MLPSASQSSTLRPEILSSVGHRFYVRIQHKFRQRLVEWGGSFQLMLLGYILMLPAESFTNSTSFLAMGSLMTEDSWGILLFIVGTARLIGLIVNGSMESVTPWIRTIGAIFGFACFAVITYSMVVAAVYVGAPPSTGIAMYLVASVMEVSAIYLAFIDAKVYQHGRRDSRMAKSIRDLHHHRSGGRDDQAGKS